MPGARYDAVADFYESGWSDVYDDPVTLSFFSLLGVVDGSLVLDVACGHGRITREIARRGARVIGVDLSDKLLDKAKAIQDERPLDITYHRVDVGTDPMPQNELFDVVTCSFGLADIDDLSGCIDSIARALKPGGRFVFSLLHPCFGGGGEVSGSWPTTKTYFDEGWWLAQGRASSLRRQVGANHRMLSTYVNTLFAADSTSKS